MHNSWNNFNNNQSAYLFTRRHFYKVIEQQSISYLYIFRCLNNWCMIVETRANFKPLAMSHEKHILTRKTKYAHLPHCIELHHENFNCPMFYHHNYTINLCLTFHLSGSCSFQTTILSRGRWIYTFTITSWSTFILPQTCNKAMRKQYMNIKIPISLCASL